MTIDARPTAEQAIERIVDITQDWNLSDIGALGAMRRILLVLEEHSGETSVASVETRTIADLLEEIQRLTRYEARVVLGTMYYSLRSPAHTDQPLAVYRTESDQPEDMPYYASLPEYGDLDGIGRTWEEALAELVDRLKAKLADR